MDTLRQIFGLQTHEICAIGLIAGLTLLALGQLADLERMSHLTTTTLLQLSGLRTRQTFAIVAFSTVVLLAVGEVVWRLSPEAFFPNRDGACLVFAINVLGVATVIYFGHQIFNELETSQWSYPAPGLDNDGASFVERDPATPSATTPGLSHPTPPLQVSDQLDRLTTVHTMPQTTIPSPFRPAPHLRMDELLRQSAATVPTPPQSPSTPRTVIRDPPIPSASPYPTHDSGILGPSPYPHQFPHMGVAPLVSRAGANVEGRAPRRPIPSNGAPATTEFRHFDGLGFAEDRKKMFKGYERVGATRLRREFMGVVELDDEDEEDDELGGVRI
jgi:hypothetical protein